MAEPSQQGVRTYSTVRYKYTFNDFLVIALHSPLLNAIVDANAITVAPKPSTPNP